jgi:hypothetical protein
MAEYTVTVVRSPGTTDTESKMRTHCPPCLPAQTGELTPGGRGADDLADTCP